MRRYALLPCLLLAGCAGSPTSGEDETAHAPAATVARALELHRVQQYGGAAALVEALAAPGVAPEQRETVLFLLAECRFQLGLFETAYDIFLLLAKDYPDSRALTLVPHRLYLIGKAWIEQPQVFLFGIHVDRSRGEEALSRVVIDFPRSIWADDAWLDLAAAHHLDGDHHLAALACESLLRAYPRSELREAATFRAAEEYQHISRGPAYDAEPLLRARQAAVRYLKEYGNNGRYADQAVAMIQSLTAAVATSERAIADYYRLRGATTGERLHDINARRLLGLADASDAPDSTELLRPRFDRPLWHAGGTPPPLLLDAPLPRPVPSASSRQPDERSP